MTPHGRAATPEQKRAVIERLYAAWLATQHLRLGQMIACAVRGGDPFYVEDEALADACEALVNRSE